MASAGDQDEVVKLRKTTQEIWKWFDKRLEPLRKQRADKCKAAESAANLSGIFKEQKRMEKARAKAHRERREAEERLAKLAGWQALGPVPHTSDTTRAAPKCPPAAIAATTTISAASSDDSVEQQQAAEHLQQEEDAGRGPC